MEVPTQLPDREAEPPTASLRVVPWPDSVIDTVGVDPRSNYVETYWLGVLGPSTTWLMRRLVAGLDTSPAGYDLNLVDTARSLGLGEGRGRNSPFVRALSRSVQFDLARSECDSVLAVRRRIPPLSRRQIVRLPESLQASHRQWQQDQLRVPAVNHQRVKELALTLVELGEDLGDVESQLRRWRFPSSMAQEAAGWAWERHRVALEASAGRPPPLPDLALSANAPSGRALEL